MLNSLSVNVQKIAHITDVPTITPAKKQQYVAHYLRTGTLGQGR